MKEILVKYIGNRIRPFHFTLFGIIFTYCFLLNIQQAFPRFVHTDINMNRDKTRGDLSGPVVYLETNKA